MMNTPQTPAKATIAWLTPDGVEPEPRVFIAAADAGFRLLAGKDCERNHPVDIAVADLRGLLHARSTTAETIARARAAAPLAGLVIATSAGVSAADRAMLRRYGDVCYVGADAAPVIAAIRDRLRLVALADETGERIKSLVAEGRTVSFAGLVEKPATITALVAGRPSPLTLGSTNALKRITAETYCVFSAGQVMRALDHCRFDCLIVNPATEMDLLLALTRALRRHRDHRRISVFIASDDDDLLDRCVSRDGFEVILAPHIDTDLGPRVVQAVRRARMASSMREFLRSGEGCGGGKDGATNARFFAHHATRAFRRSVETGTPTSLVAFALQPHAASADNRIAAAISDALRTAARLVRAEDMLVRLTPTTFAILLRHTQASEAAAIAARIEGVIAGTLRRSTLDIANISTAAIERNANDDLEHTIARLLHSLRPRAAASGIIA